MHSNSSQEGSPCRPGHRSIILGRPRGFWPVLDRLLLVLSFYRLENEARIWASACQRGRRRGRWLRGSPETNRGVAALKKAPLERGFFCGTKAGARTSVTRSPPRRAHPAKASGSELGRQVAVDFEADADLDEGRGCPGHGFSSLVCVNSIQLNHLGPARKVLASSRPQNVIRTRECRVARQQRQPPRKRVRQDR